VASAEKFAGENIYFDTGQMGYQPET